MGESVNILSFLVMIYEVLVRILVRSNIDGSPMNSRRLMSIYQWRVLGKVNSEWFPASGWNISDNNVGTYDDVNPTKGGLQATLDSRV